jgi:Tol biopolymer transport system component
MLPIDANHGKTTGSLRAVTSDAATEKMPGISADGKKLIFASDRMGNDDIWFKDLDTGKETVLAATPWPESLPVLSGDGSKVLYYRDEQQKTAIYSISAGGGVSDKVCEGCGWPCDWSRDQKYAVIQYRFNDPLSTLGLLDLGSGAKAEIVKHARYRLYRGHFSPDQRWMTFHADDLRGRTPVIIAPFRGAQSLDDSEWITVSEGEAFEDAPRWSPDGNLLYYLSDRDGARCLWAQRLDPATKRPLGGAFAVQHSHGKRYSIAGVPVNALDICVAGDKVVFNMAELKGNIWVAELLERK